MKNSSRINMKGHSARSRAISTVAAAILIATTLFIAPPTNETTAYAEEILAGTPERPDMINIATVSKGGAGYDFDGSDVTIKKSGYYSITGTSNNKSVVVNSGVTAHIVLDKLTINRKTALTEGKTFFIHEGSTVFLKLVNSSLLQAGDYFAAINVASGAALVIGGSGSLKAEGGKYGAGIGGEYLNGCGNITIDSGNINAAGKSGGAGIGGSKSGINANVTINGGKIIATSAEGGAGIGGGQGNITANISINGGHVTAKCYNRGGAGIGGGAGGKSSMITINGGKVYATGGASKESSYGGGAGIGGGGGVAPSDSAGGASGNVTITGDAWVENTGGTASAAASQSGGGAGIGGGGGAMNSPGGTAGIFIITPGLYASSGNGNGPKGDGATIGSGGGAGKDGVFKMYATSATKYTVTAKAGKGGSITPSGKPAVVRGSNKTFTVRADGLNTIKSLKINGVAVATGGLSEFTYTFLNIINSKCSIEATFGLRPDCFPLTVINGTGSGVYLAGTDIAIKANPAPAGQVFQKWVATAGIFNKANSPDATFIMPMSAATVTAVYGQKQSTARPPADEGYTGGAGGRPILKTPPSAANPIDLTKLPLTAIKVADKAWTGKQIKRGVKIDLYYSVNGKAMTKSLTENVDYTVTAAGKNKNIGKGTLTISGKAGSFVKGTKTLNFKIVPKKPTALKLKAGKKSLKITFKKVSKSQKIRTYKIQYRVKGTAKWKSKTVKVKLTGKAAKAKTASLTLKKLKPKKTYQVRVYAYKGAYKSAATGMKSKKIK